MVGRAEDSLEDGEQVGGVVCVFVAWVSTAHGPCASALRCKGAALDLVALLVREPFHAWHPDALPDTPSFPTRARRAAWCWYPSHARPQTKIALASSLGPKPVSRRPHRADLADACRLVASMSLMCASITRRASTNDAAHSDLRCSEILLACVLPCAASSCAVAWTGAIAMPGPIQRDSAPSTRAHRSPLCWATRNELYTPANSSKSSLSGVLGEARNVRR